MARDRAAVLMVRAATRGVVDFATPGPQDGRWWRRSRRLIEAMARDDELELHKASFAYQLALVGNGMLKAEDFKAVQEAARADLFDIRNVLRPWDPKTLAQAEEEQHASLAELYKEVMGVADPGDPAFVAEKAAEIAAWERDRDRRRAIETDEQRVDRLIRERDQVRRG